MAKSKAKGLSLRQLADELKRSPTAVSKWIKGGRWPFGAGPWPATLLPAIRAWMAGLQPNRAAGEVDALEMPSASDSKLERKAKLKILLERGQILEQQRKKGANELVERSLVQQRETAQATVVMNELLTIRGMALKLEGLDLQQREQALEEWARLVAGKFETAMV